MASLPKDELTKEQQVLLGFKVQGLGFRVQGLGFRVWGFRVKGLGFRVWV